MADPILSSESFEAALVALAHALIDHAEELTALDQAIGDGDHGVNMKRGMEAALVQIEKTKGQPAGAVLKGLGTTLVMTVGGASGPLYGSLFLSAGKALGEEPLTYGAAVKAIEAGIEAVMARGKSHGGEKTMLEVLLPVLAALKAESEASPAFAAQLKAVADKGAESTIPMQATKGRASFLGERSIGHLDPGARSSQLIVHAVCDTLSP